VLEAPDRLRAALERRRPSETVYVLARSADGALWRYLGVGRPTEDASVWAIVEVDYATWRAWWSGNEVSRPVPQELLEAAAGLVAALLAKSTRELRRADGRVARVLGQAPRGGLRIDGGEGGFAERTVSLIDIAWALAAQRDVKENGGLLDEVRLNRMRYLEGPIELGPFADVVSGGECAAIGRNSHLQRPMPPEKR
jgi:hypothetical protein